MFSGFQQSVNPQMTLTSLLEPQVVLSPFQMIYQGAKAKDLESIKVALAEVSVDVFELPDNASASCRLARENDIDSVNFLRDNFNASLLLIIRSYAETGNETEAFANYELAKVNDPDNARLYLIEGLANYGNLPAVYSILGEMEVSGQNKNKAINKAISSFAAHNHITQAQALMNDIKNNFSENKEVIAEATKSLIWGSNWDAGFELYETMDPLYHDSKEKASQHLIGNYVITHPVTAIYSQIQLLKDKFKLKPEDNLIYVLYAINYAAMHRYESMMNVLAIAKWACPEMLTRMINECGLWLPSQGDKQIFKAYLEWVNKYYPDLYISVVNHLLAGCQHSVHKTDLDYFIAIIKSHRTEDIKVFLCSLLENSLTLGKESPMKIIHEKIVQDYPDAEISAIAALAKGYAELGNHEMVHSILIDVKIRFTAAEFFFILNIITCGLIKRAINPNIWPLLEKIKDLYPGDQFDEEKVKVLQDVACIFADKSSHFCIKKVIDLIQKSYPKYRLETLRRIADKMVKESRWEDIEYLLGIIYPQDRYDYLEAFAQYINSVEDAKKLIDIVITVSDQKTEIISLITSYLAQSETSVTTEEWLKFVKEHYPSEIQYLFIALVFGYTRCKNDSTANFIMDKVKKISQAVASNNGIQVEDVFDEALCALDNPEYDEMLITMIAMKTIGFSCRGDFNLAIKLLDVIIIYFKKAFDETLDGAIEHAIVANRSKEITPLYNHVIEHYPAKLGTFLCNMAAHEKHCGNNIDKTIVLKGLSSIKSNKSRLNAAEEMNNTNTTNFDVMELKTLSLKYNHHMRKRRLSFDETLCWINPVVRFWLLHSHKIPSVLPSPLVVLIATYLVEVPENVITSAGEKLRTNYSKNRFFSTEKRFLYFNEEISAVALRKRKSTDEGKALVKRHRC